MNCKIEEVDTLKTIQLHHKDFLRNMNEYIIL